MTRNGREESSLSFPQFSVLPVLDEQFVTDSAEDGFMAQEAVQLWQSAGYIGSHSILLD